MTSENNLSEPFVVSSPGKVILFGEHSVVHGQPAIAAAVSLRTYFMVSDDDNNKDYVTLKFPDTDLEKSWKASELPYINHDDISNVPEGLSHELFKNLEPHLEDIDNSFQHAAALAFLYLYCSICNAETPAHVYVAKSVMPIGAGLGSSASFTVCIAASLLKAAGYAEQPDAAELINSWSFLGEKCIHGNPSGIDNAVATYGGAVYFQREPKLMETLDFPQLNLVLTNTAIPRRTSDLVAGVGKLKDEHPKISNPIMDSMGEVSREAYKLIKNHDKNIGAKLGNLARINHGLLVAIGVSHPALETVKKAADEVGLGQTKLTGAGGGGCAITIIGGEKSEREIKSFENNLPNDFEVFETVLGSQGAGYTKVNISVQQFLDLKGSKAHDELGEWNYWKHSA